MYVFFYIKVCQSVLYMSEAGAQFFVISVNRRMCNTESASPVCQSCPFAKYANSYVQFLSWIMQVEQSFQWFLCYYKLHCSALYKCLYECSNRGWRVNEGEVPPPPFSLSPSFPATQCICAVFFWL